jgi:SulP family sulfate permease
MTAVPHPEPTEPYTPPTDRQPLFALRSMIPASPKSEVLAGLTVALALVPESVAFAFVAGVDPIIGLYSAFFLCLIASVVGGRPGMISGATGAMAVVIVALVATHGVTYLFPAVVLCGLLQITVGLLRLGKLIRMVPYSVELGFVNGLAIVIGLAQIASFYTLGDDGLPALLDGPKLGLMIGLVVLTMAIIYLLPRLTKAVPSTLAAIVVVALIGAGINANWGGEPPVTTVKDSLVDGQRAANVAVLARGEADSRAAAAAELVSNSGLSGAGVELASRAELDGHGVEEAIRELPPEQVAAAIESVDEEQVTMASGLPIPFFLDGRYDGLLPPLTWATLWIILPYSLILCGVGLIESLMTMRLIDELTETRGRGNRECVGQGTANVVCGFFGGMGGCAMIGQSLINVKSGGRARLSSIVAACSLLAFILLLAPLIEQVPMAALVGVMGMVVIGTFEWATLRTWRKLPLPDVLIMVFVAGYTVLMHDLATAVILGVIFSALSYAWKASTHLIADTKFNEHGSKIYQLHGPLFFGSTDSYKKLFDPANDPDDVVIDFYFTRVWDQSGLEAINAVAEKYGQLGKRVHLTHLSEDCRKLLDKASDLVEANISEDPHYHVMTDR